jgi:hypothetical protein
MMIMMMALVLMLTAVGILVETIALTLHATSSLHGGLSREHGWRYW